MGGGRVGEEEQCKERKKERREDKKEEEGQGRGLGLLLFALWWWLGRVLGDGRVLLFLRGELSLFPPPPHYISH